MKIQVKDIKIGDIFTECGMTVRVVKIHENNLLNGTKGLQLVTETLKLNPKIYSSSFIRHLEKQIKEGTQGFSFYNKKSETFISIQ